MRTLLLFVSITVAGALGCASPTGIDPQKPTIGPRLGESTAPLPSDPSVPPPDAGGPRELSVPTGHELHGPPGAPAQQPAAAEPQQPANPPTPAGTQGETVTPEQVPSDPFPSP